MNFQTHNNIRSMLVLTILMFLCFSATLSDKAKDKEECTESLVGLATCLPYVGGTAKSPTADCCSGLKQLLKTKKKCLCVVIEDRNDPDLGLDINVTLALGLPRSCNAPANISECPALLNLPPNSPDAQIFYQVEQKSNNSSTNSSTPVPNVKPNPPSSVTPGSSFQQKSGGCGSGKKYLGLEILFFVGVVLLLCFNADLIIMK